MSQKQESDDGAAEEKKAEQMVESVPMSAGDPVATVAAASVAYSWFNYYVRGNKQYGIFTGLWAPTLFAAASYLQQKDLVRKLREGFSSF